MNIVLLPGLDGTGELFEGLLPYLHGQNVQIISLPNSGIQSYEYLASYVKTKLPKEDFVLVAESFSGPIGVLLAAQKVENLKKVVFVATFISPPRKNLVILSKYLPIRQALNLPFSSLVLKYTILGFGADDLVIKKFAQVVSRVPGKVLKNRLSAVLNFKLDRYVIDVPAVYIQASSDRLVPGDKHLEYRQYFNKIQVVTVEGPHFILQACPAECTKIIVGG